MAVLHDLGVGPGRPGRAGAAELPVAPRRLPRGAAPGRGRRRAQPDLHRRPSCRTCSPTAAPASRSCGTKAVETVARRARRPPAAHGRQRRHRRDLPALSRLAAAPARERRPGRSATRCGGTVPAGVARLARPREAAPRAQAPSARAATTSRCCSTPAARPAPRRPPMLTHRNLVANVVHGQAWARFREGDGDRLRRAAVLPRVRPDLLPQPARLHRRDAGDVPELRPRGGARRRQTRRPATFMAGVAPMFDRIVAAAEAAKRRRPRACSHVRLGFAGAMPIPAATVRALGGGSPAAC